MSRALLVLAITAALLAPAAAQEGRTVAVVLDRSASLRASDPQGRGPRLLAQTLALTLGPQDRLTVLATGGPDVPARAVGDDPASLAPLFRSLLAATPRPGGADLTAALVTACRRAGKRGLVIVYTDDDLDVVRPDGTVPAQAMAKARASDARPTRTQVNAAARALLVAAVERVGPRPALVGLRAPLPPRARATPILSALGAKVVELGADELPAADAIAQGLQGDPRVARVVLTRPDQRALELPYPAKVAVASAAKIALPGATSLDGGDGRLWLVETPGALALPGGRLRCVVVPVSPIPEGVRGYRLRRGVIRAVAPGAPERSLAVRYAGKDHPLVGSPPSADLQTEAGAAPPVLLRTVHDGARRVITARRALALSDASVPLAVTGTARVGRTLTLTGNLPAGLALATLPVLVEDAAGLSRRVELRAADGKLSGTYVCQSPGALKVQSDGDVEVTLQEPVEVAAAASNSLVIDAIEHQGQPVTGAVSLDGEGKVSLTLRLRVNPKPPAPLRVKLTLAGAPDGATLAPAEPLTIGETLAPEVTITWPEGASATLISVRVTDVGGAAEAAEAPLSIRPAASRLKTFLAAGLLVLAVLWGLWIFRWRKREEDFLQQTIAKKQLRTLGPNGRISPERYLLRDYFETSDQGVIVQPEESPGGEMVFKVRSDGNVDVEARDGAKLVHADRPTVLADKVILSHGTAFAMVHKNRALRYVYLQDEPSGDELSHRWLGDGVSYDVEMRDSGVFVLLDEDQNVPKMSARLEASADTLFPDSEIVEDSAEEVAVVPSDPGRPVVSDEGIVIMDSAEGKIMESEDLEFLARSTDLGSKLPPVDDPISMDDLLTSDSVPPASDDDPA